MLLLSVPPLWLAPGPPFFLPILILLPFGSGFMSKKRKRISRRRLAGQRVLAHIPTHNLETGEHKPVTAPVGSSPNPACSPRPC